MCVSVWKMEEQEDEEEKRESPFFLIISPLRKQIDSNIACFRSLYYSTLYSHFSFIWSSRSIYNTVDIG